MVKSKSATEAKSKSPKLDTKKPNDIKEKLYITKEVDSSIAILESSEDDVVLEALLFLSKYADIQVNNLNYLQQLGMMTKLLNLFNRNICILRLSLRLMNVLLTIVDVVYEIDQEMYDGKVIEISELYISHNDAFVKEFSVSILSKLAESNRITCLIFKIDLLTPILNTIKTTKNVQLLESTLKLFYVLLDAPAAISSLPEVENFDTSVLLTHIKHADKNIANLTFNIIEKLTYHGLEVFQQMFKESKLVQKMLDVLMNPENAEFHQKAISIILKCMKCEETSSYFVESLEFLKFCQWVKTCDQDYLLSCITILEDLSKDPSLRQVLFDLSVEDSILHFFRSTEKNILNKTCRAVSNMSTHKYCCERMLTPVVMKELISMLQRKDEEDPENEVALKAIFDFSRRNVNTIDMICTFGAQHVLLEYFKKAKTLSKESLLSVFEILYKIAVHPLYQKDILSEMFFKDLLNLFETSSGAISTFSCEIMTSFVYCKEFIQLFISFDGPEKFLNRLETSEDMRLIKNILVFILSSLPNDKMCQALLQSNLVPILKNLPDFLKYQAPLIDRILNLTYNIHLPLKLFETNRLEINDHLGNKFYLINGPWKGHFPFLEILEAEKRSTSSTIYVVDYTYEVIKNVEDSMTSIVTLASTLAYSINSSMKSSKHSGSTILSDTSILSITQSPFDVNYGKLSSDPFLPKYIYHIMKFLEGDRTMEIKIKILAEYVDMLLCGPKEEHSISQKIHTFKMHIESLKTKLGTNMIPIGFLRIGFHCERALLFKAIADKCCIPTSLVKGKSKFYWNEVALFHSENNDDILKVYVVDLMDNVGNLLMIGSREANQYCNLRA